MVPAVKLDEALSFAEFVSLVPFGFEELASKVCDPPAKLILGRVTVVVALELKFPDQA